MTMATHRSMWWFVIGPNGTPGWNDLDTCMMVNIDWLRYSTAYWGDLDIAAAIIEFDDGMDKEYMKENFPTMMCTSIDSKREADHAIQILDNMKGRKSYERRVEILASRFASRCFSHEEEEKHG